MARRGRRDGRHDARLGPPARRRRRRRDAPSSASSPSTSARSSRARFTLLAPDGYGGDTLAVTLFDAGGDEIARESLYEDDEDDEDDE